MLHDRFEQALGVLRPNFGANADSCVRPHDQHNRALRRDTCAWSPDTRGLPRISVVFWHSLVCGCNAAKVDARWPRNFYAQGKEAQGREAPSFQERTASKSFAVGHKTEHEYFSLPTLAGRSEAVLGQALAEMEVRRFPDGLVRCRQ